MVRRIDTDYVTTIATTNEQKFTFTGVDTYQQMSIKRVFVGLATAGVALTIYVSGDLKSRIDLTRFAAGNKDVEIDITVNPQLPLVFGLTDLAGGAHTNVPIVIEYDVNQG